MIDEPAILVRDTVTDQAVLGELYLPARITPLQTLEPPWRGNQPNISCIPAGRYRVTYLARSASGKYRRVWHIQGVPGRAGILFHQGNVPAETRGCILIGWERGELRGRPAVLKSASALYEMNDTLREQSFELAIIGGQNA